MKSRLVKAWKYRKNHDELKADFSVRFEEMVQVLRSAYDWTSEDLKPETEDVSGYRASVEFNKGPTFTAGTIHAECWAEVPSKEYGYTHDSPSFAVRFYVISVSGGGKMFKLDTANGDDVSSQNVLSMFTTFLDYIESDLGT